MSVVAVSRVPPAPWWALCVALLTACWHSWMQVACQILNMWSGSAPSVFGQICQEVSARRWCIKRALPAYCGLSWGNRQPRWQNSGMMESTQERE